ncbi:MAG: ABC transporter ATP-binding protein [Lachnospiraceae bacterium]|nr:ABC transporter ATP-binding protein [Lachnospiraceae bacterium]MDE7238151.1 ABC transporter ATP-binding protein [Lachnospiraceae bacterium]
MALIQAEGLTKIYQSGKNEYQALHGVSFQIEKGEFVAVTGRSGCGKSTLLNILGGMDRQTQGRYLFEDADVSGMKNRALANFRNKKIGFVFQSFYLAGEMDAAHNVALPMGYGGVRAAQRRRRAAELLAEVGLENKLKSKPSQMSGGEQQRVAIARAIANSPSVLLADEPTGNLDHENGKQIMELLRRLNREGLTIVMVTHDLELAGQTDRLIKMQDGRIIE